MYKIKLDLGHHFQTLEFGDTYAKFTGAEILKMVLDLLDGTEFYSINIDKL